MKSITLLRTDNINFTIPVLYNTYNYAIHYSIDSKNIIYTITHIPLKKKVLQLNNLRKAKKLAKIFEKEVKAEELEVSFEARRKFYYLIKDLLKELQIKDFTLMGNYQ